MNHKSTDDQEIDLSQIRNNVNNVFQSLLDKIFEGFLFIKRNSIIISILFVVGAGLGFYLDREEKIYDNQIIVIPNFESVDYLYSRINLLNSKIKERDKTFLKKVGINDPEKIAKIEVKPILDVYQFIDNAEPNFQMLKLMAEDGDIQKILEDNVTSKNYKFHAISFITRGVTDRAKIVEPLMKFLNENDYLKKIQHTKTANVKLRIKSNEETINQINGILNQLAMTTGAQQKSDKLVYYNENTQLNEVIKTKENLVNELGALNVRLEEYTDIIKESSTTLNVRNTKLVNGKMKLVLPVLFIGLFLFFGMVQLFYKKQMIKRNLA